jgi:hypothetical protein
MTLLPVAVAQRRWKKAERELGVATGEQSPHARPQTF